jgi:hypothetical protein
VDIKTSKKLAQLYTRQATLLRKLGNHRAKVIRRETELRELDAEIRSCERRATAENK